MTTKKCTKWINTNKEIHGNSANKYTHDRNI